MSIRSNNATEAAIDLGRVFDQGQFKLVYKGTYTRGERRGEECVAKIFKTGSVYEDSFFEHELAVVQKALQIVDNFNNAGLINHRIILNQPQIWTFTENLL
jgi:hypothetical protein